MHWQYIKGQNNISVDMDEITGKLDLNVSENTHSLIYADVSAVVTKFYNAQVTPQLPYIIRDTLMMLEREWEMSREVWTQVLWKYE